MTPGPLQIVLIVLLIMLLLGAGRLPRIMGDLAEGIKSFKKGMKDDEPAKQIEDKEKDTDKV